MADDFRAELVQYIRDCVTSGGFGSPTALARAAGVHPSTVNRYLQGTYSHTVTTLTLLKLAKASGTTLPPGLRAVLPAAPPPAAPEILEAFALRLRSARLERAEYARDLARLSTDLQITEARYGALERGESEPTLDELRRLARVLRLSLDYLIGGSGTGPTNVGPAAPPRDAGAAATRQPLNGGGRQSSA